MGFNMLLFYEKVALHGPSMIESEFILFLLYYFVMMFLVNSHCSKDPFICDEGLIDLSQDSSSRWLIKSQEMETNDPKIYNKKIRSHEKLQRLNTIMAV